MNYTTGQMLFSIVNQMGLKMFAARYLELPIKDRLCLPMFFV
jgi:hypothetical protein